MRITNNMMVNTLMANLKKNLNRMSRRQDQLATGKQVLAASDDPIQSSRILKFKSDIAQLGQFGKNTNDALSWMEVSESSIADVGTVLQRMRELAVQAANGTNSAVETQQIEKEISQLKDQIVKDGNFNFAGRYVFSGNHTDQKLFNDDGTFNVEFTDADIAEPQVAKYQIGVGDNINVSTNGLDIFGYTPGLYATEQYLALGSTTDAVPPAGTVPGVAATKGELRGAFDLTLNYTLGANNLDVTVDGTPYAVDELFYALDGTSLDMNNEKAVSAFKDRVLEALNKSVNGPNTLSQVADVYFDHNNELVIKSKTFGVHTVTEGSAGWVTTSTAGIASTQPVLTDTTKVIPGAIGATEQTELRETAVYLTVNGDRQRIAIDPLAVLNTPADYQAALQTAVDGAFGPGAVTVGEAGGVISFTGNLTPDGSTPYLTMEHVRTKTSSLMEDIDAFVVALNTNDKAAISTFLNNVDTHMNRILSVRADIGARVNRMDLNNERIGENSVSFTKMLSDSEDADMAEVIMYLKNAENVYKASLSTGAQAIQPSLIDFIR